MKIGIKNRWTAEVIFSAEADSIKAAVLLAIEAGANLSSADLRRANLRSADLRRANLRSADLSSADLSSADLSSADLRSANLSSANLRRANMDFTNIPMWCGTLKGVKVDISLVRQMLLHIFALDCEDKTFKTIKRLIKPFAKLSDKWHYYDEKQKGE
jgi:hypothetical protein